MTEPITPPIIEDNFLRKLNTYKQIMEYKTKIESTNKYKVELRDLSLGKQIPAIAIILYNIREASYFVKIGVHPMIEIAIERCFTELMQGKLIENYPGMITLSDSQSLLKRNDNNYTFFINGEAAFPVSFFTGDNSYPTASEYNSFNNNDEMKDYLVNIIINLGYRIFYNDATKSDIKTLHFIVPGMSEMNSPDSKIALCVIQEIKISNLIKEKLNNLSIQDANSILLYLKNDNINRNRTLDSLIKGIILKKPNIYNDTTIHVFKFGLYLIIKDYVNALKCINEFNNELKKDNKKSLYFDCYASFLSFLVSNININTIAIMLKKFYKSELVNRVISDFNSYPFKEFPNIICDNFCESCTLGNICLRKEELIIYNKLRLR